MPVTLGGDLCPVCTSMCTRFDYKYDFRIFKGLSKSYFPFLGHGRFDAISSLRKRPITVYVNDMKRFFLSVVMLYTILSEIQCRFSFTKVL